MSKFFYNLGRKAGASLMKGKWYYKSVFGSEEESIRAEYSIGKQLALKMEEKIPTTKDQQDNERLNEIGERLCKRLVNKTRKFKFCILSSRDINAFALPGGFIYITRQLYDMIKENPNEVAFVLAHEIMHVVEKHPFDRILSDYSIQIITNIIFKGGPISAIANKAMTSFLRSTYSQDNELEADSYAVKLMYAANFDPLASTTMLCKLKKDSPEKLPIYNYFISHPTIEDRIQKIESLVKRKNLLRDVD